MASKNTLSQPKRQKPKELGVAQGGNGARCREHTDRMTVSGQPGTENAKQYNASTSLFYFTLAERGIGMDHGDDGEVDVGA